MKAEKSLNDLIEAQKAKEMVEFRITLQNVKGILKGSNCPPKESIKQINDVKAKYPNDADLQNQINEILNQLNNCK